MTDNTDEFKSKLAVYQKQIDIQIASYFSAQDGRLGPKPTSYGDEAFEMLQEFSLRSGKRVRGALAIVSYKMFGGKNDQTAQDLAVAIELIQNYLLIIDDVMDRSKLRRKKPTIHEKYIKKLSDDHGHKDATHLGNMLAINVGLLAQHMAANIILNLNEDDKPIVRASKLNHSNVSATIYGQIQDLFNDALMMSDESSIDTVHLLKSSYYTFINPLQLGATLAGKDADVMQTIIKFGSPAGMAFQLQDDIIGLYGDELKTGKSALDDLREGKMTLLIQHALAKGNKEQIGIIKKALGNSDVTEREHTEVKNIVREVGALEYTQIKARKLTDEAIAVLAKSNWPEEGKQFIAGLSQYILSRSK